MFEGKIIPTREKLEGGYFELYLDFVQDAMTNYTELHGGLCDVKLDDDTDSVVDQLWPYLKTILNHASEMIKPLLKIAGVSENTHVPFL